MFLLPMKVVIPTKLSLAAATASSKQQAAADFQLMDNQHPSLHLLSGHPSACFRQHQLTHQELGLFCAF